MAIEQSPYKLAFITALLAGIFSSIGGYFLSNIQAEHVMKAKQFEYRVLAYQSFLQKIDRKRSPLISQLLSIGSLADTVATDGEIQTLEDNIYKLLQELNTQEAYWMINNDFNILKLHGDIKTRAYCEDILLLISLRDFEINWSKYPIKIQTYYKKWIETQDKGIAYGWEERISNDERLMVIMIGKMFDALILHMNQKSK